MYIQALLKLHEFAGFMISCHSNVLQFAYLPFCSIHDCKRGLGHRRTQNRGCEVDRGDFILILVLFHNAVSTTNII